MIEAHFPEPTPSHVQMVCIPSEVAPLSRPVHMQCMRFVINLSIMEGNGWFGIGRESPALWVSSMECSTRTSELLFPTRPPELLLIQRFPYPLNTLKRN